ncbi:MAG: hypothetical protein JWO92_439 [Chitinophagaceae bacterium]|nr:hypothetical protein [Chitinophagaceae bacterium]MDB5222441.1 hypothetical protein [Chitinophagaceae bacterium]
MNIEIDQQQKFTEQFFKMVHDAPQRFKDKWDGNIRFINPTRTKYIPSFNGNAIDLLSVELRNKFEILRNKYYSKSL